MSQFSRYLQAAVFQDLLEKMVFIGGPRQVGKTTFALGFLKGSPHDHPAYLNWDVPQAHSRLMRGELPPGQKLIVLDEIHKYARWRNLVKGLYDRHRASRSFIVTGSARLDYYNKGGDSLQGRYHYYRLHPISLREIGKSPTAADLEALIKFGGFPEPFFKASERHWRRWQVERMHQVLRDDLRDLEKVREISLIELLLEALPSRVGSPLSVRSLREDLQVAHDSVERWIQILENLYVVFRVPPYGAPKIRAVKKEQKLYFWDWSAVPDDGARLENLVASQLLKYCHWIQDTEGFRMELRYLRDTDKREVDFIVLRDKNPEFAVECKTGEKRVSASLRYFSERVAIPKVFQVHFGERDFVDSATGIRVLPFQTFCRELELP